MSKQQDNALNAPPEFGSKKMLEKLESLGDALIESLTNNRSKKGNLEIGTQNFVRNYARFWIPTTRRSRLS